MGPIKILLAGDFYSKTDSDDSCSDCNSILGHVDRFEVGEIPKEEIGWTETESRFYFCHDVMKPCEFRHKPPSIFLEIMQHVRWVLQGKRNCVLPDGILDVYPHAFDLCKELDYTFIGDNYFIFKRGWVPKELGILVNRETYELVSEAETTRVKQECKRVSKQLGAAIDKGIVLERHSDIISINGYMLEYPIVHYCAKRPKSLLVEQIIDGEAVKYFAVPENLVSTLDSCYTVRS